MALCIAKLPKAEHDAKEWQAAMEALMLVAEHDGPTMFARIGVMRAELPDARGRDVLARQKASGRLFASARSVR